MYRYKFSYFIAVMGKMSSQIRPGIPGRNPMLNGICLISLLSRCH